MAEKLIKQKIMTFDEYSSFACTGSSCPDHCCVPNVWKVSVTNAEYKLYQTKFKENAFGALLEGSLVKSGKDYCFKADDKGVCPLLTEENLCGVYIELGKGYMCCACKVFPRVTLFYNGFAQHTLSLGCPEAARLGCAYSNSTKKTMQEVKTRVFTTELRTALKI